MPLRATCFRKAHVHWNLALAFSRSFAYELAATNGSIRFADSSSVRTASGANLFRRVVILTARNAVWDSRGGKCRYGFDAASEIVRDGGGSQYERICEISCGKQCSHLVHVTYCFGVQYDATGDRRRHFYTAQSRNGANRGWDSRFVKETPLIALSSSYLIR